MNKLAWKVKLLFPLIFLTLALFSVSLSLNISPNKQLSQKSPKTGNQTNNQAEVLGRGYSAPQIYISGGEGGYSSGGMIALASTDEPAVQIGGYNIPGPAEISVYEANSTLLLDYLIHDKEGKQVKKSPDTSKLQLITTLKDVPVADSYSGSKVTLPLKETGIWYLKVKTGSIDTSAFVIRSDIGVLAKEGNNEFIFWGQNFKTKRSVTDGNIKIYNLQDTQKELQTISFNADGIAKGNLTADADIAFVIQNNDRAVVPINLKYLNTDYSYKPFESKNRLVRYFIFTDRPLYKPGDIVNFKAVLRDDDDARYTVSGGEASVKIYNGYYYSGSENKPVFEKKFPVSSDGTISGQYNIPATSKVGYYTLAVTIPNQSGNSNNWSSERSSNTISFNVEFFRKPEALIDITTSSTESLSGDKSPFKIIGTYFSGQPLANQKVKYTVYASDFYEYDYLSDSQSFSQSLSNDYRYSYWYGGNKITEGTVALDNKGEALIDLDTKMNFNKGKSQVFSIGASLEGNLPNPVFSKRNILVYAGEYGIYRKNYSYGTKINLPVSIPIALVPYRSNSNVGNVNLTAKIHRTNWISYQEADKKYPSYKKDEEDLPQITVKTDSKGNAVLTFTPTKTGSYNITVSGSDSRGNQISKVFYSYATSEDQPYYSSESQNNLTIVADQQKYQPTDTARFNIFSDAPNRDIFLSLERGRVQRYQTVRMEGKNATVDIPLVNTDAPNIYVKAESFSNFDLESGSINVPVSAEGKRLVVNITPNNKTYGPSETANINILTTDTAGNPVPSEVALWAVDKAIFELSDNKLGDIFKTFWKERTDTTEEAHSLEGIVVNRAERGGCFGKGTQVLMSDGKLKNIEDIKENEYVLTRLEKDPQYVKAKVLKVHQAEENGYLIINNHLKVTANHKIFVNNTWREAGSIQIGDILTNTKGQAVKVSSIEWQRGKFSVYNLEIEKYHTYFADGVWVHNDKGSPREIFKDTAYWNPSIHTDSSGRGQVSFKLPDNLTTWTVAAVGATADTRVGQATNEIVVSKDVIIRPILPNILRQDDEVFLSALVQNFTENDQAFDISLKFDGGDVEKPEVLDVLIKARGMQQFTWKVLPAIEKEKAKLIFAAKVKNNPKLQDIVTQEIPVRAFGFSEKTAQTGNSPKTYTINLAQDAHQDKSSVILSISPTLIGSLPQAMKYLVDYPYGCVEQTTSRFVPAVIAKANSSLFAESLEGKDIDGIIKKGLSRLQTLQKEDGGWTWHFSGESDIFVTSYVIEYLLAAKDQGIGVDEEMLSQAQKYLENQQTQDSINSIPKMFALSLMNSKKAVKITDFNNLTPDFIALAVMTNYKLGDKNPQTNGLSKLISMQKTQGDGIFWDAGNKTHFGSVDATTALAIKAITKAGGDRDVASKAARYLTRARKNEYWSNTFATAQTIGALVDLSKTGDEMTPDYTYSVELDGKQLTKGTVTSSKQIIKDIKIPVKSIKKEGSGLTINKSGEGQIYTVLLLDQFHTDKNSKPLDKGLIVRREYVNEKGPNYNLAVGDTVLVNITIGGLGAEENYGVINDELPAGLIPINTEFKNEQYGQGQRPSYDYYSLVDREISENGISLSLYRLPPVNRTYSYKARVVSAGTFIVPPATASLMYAPEVFGRSDVQTLKIVQESINTPFKAPQSEVKKQNWIQTQGFVAATIFISFVAAIIIFTFKRFANLVRKIIRK